MTSKFLWAIRSTKKGWLVCAYLSWGALTAALAYASSPDVVRPELATSLDATMDLDAGWNDPPREARVRCWWWWLNGNVTKEAISRDLEAMRAKGIGGANVIDAAHASNDRNHKPPHGPDFGSPNWCELFVHALSEADRLGLELGFNIQSGWNLGGPTVTAEQAAKKLTWSETTVDASHGGPVRAPIPERLGGFYRDFKVLAVPLPAEERAPLARIGNYRQKAYHDYPGGFTAVDASHLLDTDPAEPHEVAVEASQVLDLTDELCGEDELGWRPPAGRWLVLRIGYTLSGSRVSTSSDNWKGHAIDYLDGAAFDRYCDDVLTPILETASPYVGKSLRFLHTDSWELGPVNWTPALPQEFRARRGYDMTPYLPALAGYVVDDRKASTRFLNDFRRTLGDLIADGKYRAFSRYAHERGLAIHPESGGPHAAPVDSLLCLGQSDVSMGEFWARSKTHRVKDTQRLFVKQPASAAHVYGRRVVMAEAFTTIGPHWQKDPRDLKPVFDRMACEGLNLTMWHTFDCSPPEAGVPGNAYFAGTHLNPNVTWWNYAEGFLGYLNRCHFLLQQGLPVADVLHFYGENVPNFVRLKRDDPAGVLPGFDYDVVNLEALCERANVEGGRIVLPDGASYAVLSLPPSGHYGLEALRTIARLAEGGATIVGEKPESPIGLLASDAEREEFRALSDRLWDEGLVRTMTAKQALHRLALKPDFSYPERGDRHLDYVHRRTSREDIYFIANRRSKPCRTECRFRVVDRKPEFWDPVYGTIAKPDSWKPGDAVTRVTLDLPPHGAMFVVFRDDLPTKQHLKTLDAPSVKDTVMVLGGPWQVAFDAALGGPGTVEFDALRDWSLSPMPGVRHYSGTASYHKSFDWNAEFDANDRVWLDLGEVNNLARVSLNGVDLGVAWTPPFRVNLSPALREGSNDLKIDVVNLWPNRLIGDATLPANQRLTRTNVTSFTGDQPLLPSGLLGPVRVLIAGRAHTPVSRLPPSSGLPR